MIRFRAPRWEQEDLAKRLCQLIYGTDKVYGENGRWYIGTANDWRLHEEGDGAYRLNYRYSTHELMQALSTVMAALLHVEVIAVYPAKRP